MQRNFKVSLKKMIAEIEKRYSPLIFDERNISEKDLMEIFKAASKAPSSYNEQPWLFYYAYKGSKAYEKLLESMVSYNKAWASTAPVLVLISARKFYAFNQQENQHARFDTGTAVGFMLIQAMHLGIYAHMLGGFDPDLVRSSLQLENSIDIIALMALGYPGNIDLLPEDLKKRAKMRSQRKEVTEIAIKLE
jgi:nitroreductase